MVLDKIKFLISVYFFLGSFYVKIFFIKSNAIIKTKAIDTPNK